MLLASWRSLRLLRILSTLVVGFFGLLGIVLLLMWVATDHDTTVRNWNLLMAPATLVLLLVPSMRHHMRLLHVGIAAVFLVGWPLWPQQLHPATIPMALLLLTALAAPIWAARWNAG